MAHSIAAYCLKHGMRADEIVDDHAESIQMYLDYCRPAGVRRKDMRFEVDLTPGLQKIDKDMGGTADAVWLEGDELVVTDFKFGTGVAVDPVDNPQLKMYALGVLLQTARKVRKVRVVIVQPRLEDPAQRIREHTFKAVELMEFAADMEDAAEKSRAEEPVAVPGEKQCMWCPAAKGNCDVAIKRSSRRPAGARVTIEDFSVVEAK